MFHPSFSALLLFVLLVSSPLSAGTKVTEKQAGFGECRAYLQALAGALSGKLVKYTTNNDEALESTFYSSDGAKQYTIICLASEQKMIIQETTK